MRLDRKVVLVTGSARGIGRGCAEACAREGARVVLADADVSAGAAAAEAIRAHGGDAHFVDVDVAVPEQVEAMVGHALDLHGRLDVLISNAGIGGSGFGDGPVHACSVEAWDRSLTVNLRGTFLSCKYAIPALLETRGAIVTMASVLGLVGSRGMYATHAYMTGKAGIIGLTRTIAAHYAGEGLRANALAPGLIDTDMARRTKSDPALLEQLSAWQPLGPLGTIRDVAAAAVFLASDESRFITGVVLPIDGGWTAQ